MHPIGIHSSHLIEANSEHFSPDFFLEARRLSWDAVEAIRARLTPGITEPEAIAIATGVLQEKGSSRSWHRPNIRFGANTCKTFAERPDPALRLKAEDAILIDIGPVWPLGIGEMKLEYEGDAGDTFAPATNPRAAHCAETTRELFASAADRWRSERLTGDALYAWIRDEAGKRGYKLIEAMDGHRLGDFPHHRFFEDGLAGISFAPAPDLWMLEIQITDPASRIGAFYEDLLR